VTELYVWTASFTWHGYSGGYILDYIIHQIVLNRLCQAWRPLLVRSVFMAQVSGIMWRIFHLNFLSRSGRAWPYPFTVIAISVTAFLTHMFLSYRCVMVHHFHFSTSSYRSVFRLTKSKFVYGVMLLFAIASWVTGIICGTYSWTKAS
jgi:hypothetical protein